jgi:hypothetical protein
MTIFNYLDYDFNVDGNDQCSRLRLDEIHVFFKRNDWFHKKEMIDVVNESGIMDAFQKWYVETYQTNIGGSFPFEIRSLKYEKMLRWK